MKMTYHKDTLCMYTAFNDFGNFYFIFLNIRRTLRVDPADTRYYAFEGIYKISSS